MTKQNISLTRTRKLLKAGYDSHATKSGKFQVDKSLSGKRVKVFVDPTTNRVAVVHRGTQSAKDWVTNLGMTLGTEGGNRFKHAKKIQRAAEKKYGADNITTMGHSLGGRIAEKFGKNTHQIITFNKAAIPKTMFRTVPKKQLDIRDTKDLVSMAAKTQKHENPMIELQNHSRGFLQAHNVSQLKPQNRI